MSPFTPLSRIPAWRHCLLALLLLWAGALNAHLAPREVVFIDPSVADWPVLRDGVKPGVEVVVLDAGKDGLAQMAEWARSKSGYDAIHLLSHGSPGAVHLGAFSLNRETLGERAGELAAIGAALNEDGDLLLYGCEVASGTGEDFIARVAGATGADVAASTDVTGAAALGGDWTLESEVGEIVASVPFSDPAVSAFGYLLALGDQNFSNVGISVNQNSTQIDNVTYSISTPLGMYITTASHSEFVNVGSYTYFNSTFGIQDSDADRPLIFGTSSLGAFTRTPDGTNGPALGAADFRIAGGEAFRIVSMEADVGLHTGFSEYVTTLTVTGYLNGNQVAQDTVDFTSSDSAGSITYTKVSGKNGGVLTFNSIWQNLTEIQFTGSDATHVAVLAIDNLDFEAAVVGGDTTAPTATVQPITDITSAGASSFTIDVRYVDAASNIGTAGTDDIKVTHGGNTLNPTSAAIQSGSGSDVTIRYTFTPPGGAWDSADNNTYTVELGSGPMQDAANNAVTTLAGDTSFTVNIAAAPTSPYLVDNTGDTNDGNFSPGNLTLREAATLAQAGETIQFASSINGSTIILSSSIALAANVTFDASPLTTLTITGSTISLAGNLTITNDASDTLTIASVLASTGTLTKTGAGTLTLDNTGNSAATAALTVSGGAVAAASDSRLVGGTVTLDGGTLMVAGGNTYDNLISLGAGGGTIDASLETTSVATLSGIISGSGALTKTGAGTVRLNGANTYSGTTTLSVGSLEVGHASALGSTAGGTAVVNGAGLGIVGVTIAENLTITGLGSLGALVSSGTSGVSGSVTLAGNAGIGVINGGTLTISGAIDDGASTFNLTKVNASGVTNGTLVLSGANSYDGATTISAGTLVAAHNTALGTTGAGTTVANGAALAFQGDVTVAEAITSLTGTGVSGTGSLRNVSGTNTLSGAVTLTGATGIGADAGTLIISSGITDGASTYNVSKVGAGAVTLTGANIFDGTTTVSAGTLLVTGALANSTAVTVASGATLGGTGSIAGAVTIQSGGVLAPGVAGTNNGAGTLTLANGLTIASGGTLSVDIAGSAAGTGYDQVSVTGTVTVTGATVTVTHSYVPGTGDTYRLISNDGTDAITGTFASLAEGGTLTAGGNGTVLTAYYAASDAGATTGGNEFMLQAPVNQAPVATANGISSTTTVVGDTLTGSYSYNDTNGDAEDTGGTGSSYQWKRGATNVAGSASNISGASGATGGAPGNDTYVIAAADRDNYLFYCVTPKASAGTLTGTETCSTGLLIPNSGLTLTVTNTNDSGAGSLREAITNASTTAADTINFAAGLNGQTITLGSPLTIAKSLTIDGTGRKIVINGNGHQAFSITSGTVELKNLTVTGGSAANGGGLSNNGGTVTVRNSAFTGNTATGTGGAIHNASGDLTVINSTFASNSGTSGASLSVAGGTVTVLNSSFSGSSADGEIAQTGGTISLTNTLIDNATLTCTGTITNGGNNLDRGTGCGFGSASGSQSSVNPLLGALGDYGGDTQILPLLPGSPAINAGTNTGCPATDQRGIARPQGTACDIGAYESQGFSFAKSGDNQSATISTAFTNPLSVTVTATGSGQVNGGKVTFTAPGSGASATLVTSPATISGGSASVTATANATAGSYQVTASAAGATSVNFNLSNSTPGGGGGGGEVTDDGDGITDATENGAPNGGDGNGDGFTDSQQGNVTSLPVAGGSGQYLTVQTPTGVRLANVTVQTAGQAGVSGDYPWGVLSFEAFGPSPVTITLFLPGRSTVAGLVLNKIGGGQTQALNATFSIVQIGGQPTVVVSYSLSDNGPHDTCPASGQICDPVGVAEVTEPPEPPVTLTVTKTGSGAVTSVPAGITCGSDCSESYSVGAAVTLTATAASGYDFSGWSGGCAGAAPTCTLTLSANQTVTATFSARAPSLLTVTKTGNGTVSSIPAGINCGSDCSESYPANTAVTLTATAASGYGFTGWSGGCAGTAPTCALILSADQTVTATFSAIASPRAAIGVLRNGQWHLDRSGNSAWDQCGSDGCDAFGQAGDMPVVGNWDGGDRSLLGVLRAGTAQWFLDRNGNGQWDGCGADSCLTFGDIGDLPVAADWSSDGKAKMGVFRAGNWYLDANGNGRWDGCEIDRCYLKAPNQSAPGFGLSGDLPIAGDWNGDSLAKVGVFRAGNWYFDDGNGQWDGCEIDRCHLKNPEQPSAGFGLGGDYPVVGDWNGDGVLKIGVFRNGSWFFDNGNGQWDGCGIDACVLRIPEQPNTGFGLPGDLPAVGRW